MSPRYPNRFGFCHVPIPTAWPPRSKKQKDRFACLGCCELESITAARLPFVMDGYSTKSFAAAVDKADQPMKPAVMAVVCFTVAIIC